MERRSELCKLGEEISGREIGQTSQELDSNEYMDIDEFMGVLRDVELITPFGKLESTYTDVAQVDFKPIELANLHTEQNDHTCPGSSGEIRQTSTVLQVVETVLASKKTTCKAPTLCSKQHTQKILEDAVMMNYLFLLISQKGNSS